MNTKEITQLAKTFSTVCKDAVKKVEVKTYTAPIVLAAVTALLASNAKTSAWMRI